MVLRYCLFILLEEDVKFTPLLHSFRSNLSRMLCTIPIKDQFEKTMAHYIFMASYATNRKTWLTILVYQYLLIVVFIDSNFKLKCQRSETWIVRNMNIKSRKVDGIVIFEELFLSNSYCNSSNFVLIVTIEYCVIIT